MSRCLSVTIYFLHHSIDISLFLHPLALESQQQDAEPLTASPASVIYLDGQQGTSSLEFLRLVDETIEEEIKTLQIRDWCHTLP